MMAKSRKNKHDKRLDHLQEVAEKALAYLDGKGVDHAETSVGQGSRLEVNVRMGEVDLVKEAQSSGLSVRVIVGDRVATSSTNDIEAEAVERFLDRAIDMASISEPDPLAAPPEPGELAKRYKDLDLFDPKTAGITAARGIKLATTAERAALRSKKITASEGATFARGTGYSVLATSGGFVGRHAGSNQHVVAQVIADDVEGKKRNGYYWTAARHFSDLDSASAIGREAARRAISRLGARRMDTGVYPVVFDKEAAGSILGLVASCVMGDSVYRQQSYLASRLGSKIASDKVTIVDDPLIARGPGSRPYDGEGRVSRRNKVVSKGILDGFLLDTYSARKLRMEPTHSGGGGGGVPHSTTSNFIMRAGRSAPESLLKGIKRGLYVTNMMGFGFDALTGNFSRGAEGFEIVDGELGDPVGEITISRNLDELLQGIDKVANDLELRTSVAAPSFRVDHMTVSGS
jgi:PmbA protein